MVTGDPKKARRAIDDVFGDDLPQASSDERELSARDQETDRDSWLRHNVPPHHG